MPGALFYREMIAIPTAGAGPGTEHSLLSLAPASGVPALPGRGSTKASTSISKSQAQPSCSCLLAFGLSQSPLLSSLPSLLLLCSHSDPSSHHPHNCQSLVRKPIAPSPSIVPGHSHVWTQDISTSLFPVFTAAILQPGLSALSSASCILVSSLICSHQAHACGPSCLFNMHPHVTPFLILKFSGARCAGTLL